jgi:putative ABC transport system permease protein
VLNVREVLTHKARTAASTVVIATSAALLIAVLGTYGSLTGSVDKLAQSISGKADLEVAGITDTGFSQHVLSVITTHPGVKIAVPVLRASFGVGDQNLILFGVDYSVARLDSNLSKAADEMQKGAAGPKDATVENGVVAGPGLGLAVGDPVTVGSITSQVTLVLAKDPGERINGGHFYVAPLPIAQQMANRPGQLDSIFVIAEPGVDVDKLRSELEADVNGQATVAEPLFRTAQANTATRLTRDSTLMLAMIALVVAAFLVFNSTNLTVAQRRPTIAMLRAVGGRRTAIVGGLLAESALIGLFGAVVGIPLGILAGHWTIARLPPVLLQSIDARITYVLPGYAIPIAAIACVAASLAASALAARAAFHVSPLEAMTPIDVALSDERRQPFRRLMGGAGLLTMVVASVLALALRDRWVLVAGSLYVIGAVWTCYGLIGQVTTGSSWIAKRCGSPGRLSAATVEAAPRRVWASAMTVGIAVAVGIATSGSMNNMVESSSRLLTPLADTDLYVSSAPADVIPTRAVIPLDTVDRIRAIPGVQRVIPLQYTYSTVGGARVLLQGVTEGSTTPSLRAMSPQARQQVLAGETVVVSRQLAKTMGFGVGDELDLPSPTGIHRLRIAEFVDFLTLDTGLVVIALDKMQPWFERPGASYVEVGFSPGADQERVTAAVRSVLPDGLVTYTGKKLLSIQLGAIAQLGALAVGVQWIVAVVAAVALMNTLMLSVLERRRELGVLRAVGASRKFATRMVLVEALSVGLMGGVIGLVFGASLHYLATVVLSTTTSFNIAYRVEPLALLYATFALVVCLLGAFPPAWRAAMVNIIDAISVE